MAKIIPITFIKLNMIKDYHHSNVFLFLVLVSLKYDFDDVGKYNIRGDLFGIAFGFKCEIK